MPSTPAIPNPVVRTLLLSDIVGSTQLIERLGDARASEVSARHDRIVRDLLRKHGGMELNRTDGFLCAFDRPIAAVEFALELHDELAGAAAALSAQLAVRIGVHLGEVIIRENPAEDIAGGAMAVQAEGIAVPTVARIASLASASQTLLTKAAFDMARKARGGEALDGRAVRWLAHGPYLFKGMEEPEEVFEVGREGRAPLAPPSEAEKARRAVRPGEEDTLGWRPAKGLEVPDRPNWVIEEKLGEGGFGEVWLAIQKKTGLHRVFKFCFEADRLRSLKREVTLFRVLQLALGGRDDIAKVLDWQFDHPPYFLESEFTEGGTLGEWIESEGGAAAIPLELRLDVVAQIATALSAAHSAGVLHKDVKPSNILITPMESGAPRARLTDFGIGLLTEPGLVAARELTQTHLTEPTLAANESSRTGTRLYSAPELLEGQPASIQSDIYSLGVLLYQLVSGGLGRALAPGWERDIADELLRADIAACVAGRPADRLRSAGELADRLRSMPVRRRERLRRRVLRGAGIAAAALLVVSLSLGVALLRESSLRREAVAAREREARARAQSEDLTYFMLFDIFGRLQDLGRLDLMEKVSGKSFDYLKASDADEGTSGTLIRKAMAFDNVGTVLLTQGKSEPAKNAYRESLSLRERLLALFPKSAPAMRDLAVSWNGIARIEREQGNSDAAIKAFRQDLELSRRAAKAAPGDPAAAHGVAKTLCDLGDSLRKADKLDEAKAAYAEAAGLFELLVSQHVAERTWEADRARAILMLGAVEDLRGDFPAAIDAYTKSLKIAEAALAAEPDSVRQKNAVLGAHYQLGNARMKKGDLDQSLVEFAQALALAEGLAADNPGNQQNQTRIAFVLKRRATALQKKRDLEAALLDMRRVVEIYEAALKNEPQASAAMTLVLALREAGTVADAKGLKEEAARHWDRGAEVLRPLAEAKDATTDQLEEYARVLILAGRKDEARPFAKAALASGASTPEFLAMCKENGF